MDTEWEEERDEEWDRVQEAERRAWFPEALKRSWLPEHCRDHCLMCWKSRNPDDFHHATYPFCDKCDARQRAETRLRVTEIYQALEGEDPVEYEYAGHFLLGEHVPTNEHIAGRWDDYIFECLPSPQSASTIPMADLLATLGSERSREATSDAHLPTFWRVRLFHTRRHGYSERWWNNRTGQWRWAVREMDSDAPDEEWSEWRKAMRDYEGIREAVAQIITQTVAKRGRRPGTGMFNYSEVDAFRAWCQELVSESAWQTRPPVIHLPAGGYNSRQTIRRDALRARVRTKRVQQRELAAIMECSVSTLLRILDRLKIRWRDLQGDLAAWEHESRESSEP